jgi:hypothetical protein
VKCSNLGHSDIMLNHHLFQKFNYFMFLSDTVTRRYINLFLLQKINQHYKIRGLNTASILVRDFFIFYGYLTMPYIYIYIYIYITNSIWLISRKILNDVIRITDGSQLYTLTQCHSFCPSINKINVRRRGCLVKIVELNFFFF